MSYTNANGAKIPSLGFGTFRMSGEETETMVKAALDLGYRHIDTAQIYGNEADVGAGVAASDVARSDVFLTTKIWIENYQRSKFAQSLDESLSNLRTDYVDLLLLHWPNASVPLADQIGALNAAQSAGKVRHIGVSNFTTAMMDEAVALSRTPIVTNQIEYHPYLSQAKVRGVARAHSMSITAFFGMADGAVFDDPVLKDIAVTHQRSVAQIVLRWLIQQDMVVALTKTVNVERAARNLGTFDFALSDTEMALISNLARPKGRIVNPEGIAPDWDDAA